MTPTADTTCRSVPFGASAPYCEPGLALRHGHACLECAGEFRISLPAGATADIDMVLLEPAVGSSLRFGKLPVLSSIVSALQTMGVDTIRTGGTYVKIDQEEAAQSDPEGNYSGAYEWKSMRCG